MIRSMTGFARAEAEGEWGELAWELRSVNHRYLDVHLRLPDDTRALEPAFRQQVAAVIGRGKVECNLRLRAAGPRDELEIDAARLAALKAGAAQVTEAIPGCGPIDPLRLLGWPGVLRETPPDAEAVAAAAGGALDKAVADLQAARAAEGERLAGLLRERAAAIAALTAQVRERLPQVRAAGLERMRTRVAEAAVEVDEGRLEQEVAILAQRMDVDEELTRLVSHLAAFEQALAQREPVGRRLDFLMQEFNREANTLSSKSQDAEVTHCALEMKVLIEQMREQVQNIE